MSARRKAIAAFAAISVSDLGPERATEALELLAAEIGEHDRRYYQDDAPTISDAEYDDLRRLNEAIERAYPDLVRADSPSARVGAAPSETFSKVTHAAPMLSLGNVFDGTEVK
mgnify:FL=1